MFRLFIQAFGVEDLVKPRSFICCSNLTIRPDDRLQCPSLVFSELSSLTLKPRELHQRTALNKLQQSIPVSAVIILSDLLSKCTYSLVIFEAILVELLFTRGTYELMYAIRLRFLNILQCQKKSIWMFL